jgi:hypothetical protein
VLHAPSLLHRLLAQFVAQLLALGRIQAPLRGRGADAGPGTQQHAQHDGVSRADPSLREAVLGGPRFHAGHSRPAFAPLGRPRGKPCNKA